MYLLFVDKFYIYCFYVDISVYKDWLNICIIKYIIIYRVFGSKMIGILFFVLMLLCGYVLVDLKRFDGYVLVII